MRIRSLAFVVAACVLSASCGGAPDAEVDALEAPASNASEGAAPSEPAVSESCDLIAADVDGVAVAAVSSADFCAVLAVEERHEPATEVVRFFLDGEPIDVIGIGPCPIPEAFAVPSFGTRPSEEGHGYVVAGQNKAEPSELLAALEDIAGAERVEVAAFPQLDTTAFYMKADSDDLKRLLDQASAAVEAVIPTVEVPECAL